LTEHTLISALHAPNFEIAVKTNDTVKLPEGIDWVCVSPKGGTELQIRHGDESKLIFPQSDAAPETFIGLSFLASPFSRQSRRGQDFRQPDIRADARYASILEGRYREIVVLLKP
jgi:hypothetical protein